ncbi:hypothetical protein F9C07_1356481 [Aspergillus flavus]|uniref:Uncharacterized protein n=1 Tax=Aspergillus flavus (strain ATCC 200026 / FGSC A1120 / IAM 13836 / NRRL 3357 / JCM 12722 / SRRC 167) TaxID=332952 RepID=A0A7U2MGT3_ASPFN|nr:hypothetical protein F9C07_1356481 [Aspergillus flavus]
MAPFIPFWKSVVTSFVYIPFVCPAPYATIAVTVVKPPTFTPWPLHTFRTNKLPSLLLEVELFERCGADTINKSPAEWWRFGDSLCPLAVLTVLRRSINDRYVKENFTSVIII